MALFDIALYAIIGTIAFLVWERYEQWRKSPLDWDIEEERQPWVLTEKHGPLLLEELEPIGNNLYEAHFDFDKYKPNYEQGELESYPLPMSEFGINRPVLMEPQFKYKALYGENTKMREHMEHEMARITKKIISRKDNETVKEELEMLKQVMDKLTRQTPEWEDVINERNRAKDRTTKLEWELEQERAGRERDVEKRTEQFARVMGRRTDTGRSD